ncbi:NAD(P)/FAD-dependent oxidoreductase [Conexibacter sp. SYSU D00693]|uniref:flavin-containing monooxygenase n=1 Tax=Conexibacter sp. SYSU D00693 TaxID=2812560 RepID=UPI00196ADEB9|nr:NAD(P)/FAD-dependent oxidoreductase [Conexibacter sp. SYSU D00693]
MAPRVVVVGAGFAGIGTAILLRRAGVEDVVVLERGEDVGGTWRENTYPGAACDVPSHLYSFSFAPNPRWSRRYSPQPDILAYLRDCAERFGVLEDVRFGTEVVSATWDEEGLLWRLRTAAGQELEAEVLVCATGQLSEPVVPDLPGLGRFAGPLFHSAHWDHDVDLRGKDVAVVGTGASAIQFVPEIAPVVRRLRVFGRSQPWVVPKGDRAYSARHRAFFARFPSWQRAARAVSWLWFESLIPAFMAPSRRWAPLRALARAQLVGLGRAQLRAQVRDPELRARLAPTDEAGCKRVLISNDWYPTLARPHVELVDQRIAEVVEDGLVTADGTHHRADVVILGTGFASHGFVAPMQVTGRGGQDLQAAWGGAARAHLGMLVPGFPSLFVLYGPNTNLGAGSIVYMLESQARYVVDAVRTLEREGAAALDVRTAALDAFDRQTQARLEGTVWQSGCRSWYVGEDGRNLSNWPGFQLEYRRRTRRVDLRDVELLRRAATPAGPPARSPSPSPS